MHHVLSSDAVEGFVPADDRDDGDVFKALADSSRRLLLDSLFAADGQTLGELAAQLPGMTRFGVMKHLRILEAAGLVVSRKVGRERLHYLNPVPIRLMQDRWIGKYAEPWVGALADLKGRLEGDPAARPHHVFQVYIRTTPERLWEAITRSEWTSRYFHASHVESAWQRDDAVYYRIGEDLVVEGTVLDADPPRRLVMTWAFRRDARLRDDPPSRVTWEIAPRGESLCLLTLVHDGFPGLTPTFRAVGSGWPLVLSSLKSILETGEGLEELPSR